MFSRRQLFQATGAAAVIRAAHARDRRPNLLFIIADDHAGYVLGAQGNRQAQTPNLDRLGAEGTRFARHYCNSPVCTPSRQSILTGQLPHAAGVTVLKTPLDDGRPTLAAGPGTKLIPKPLVTRKPKTKLDIAPRSSGKENHRKM